MAFVSIFPIKNKFQNFVVLSYILKSSKIIKKHLEDPYRKQQQKLLLKVSHSRKGKKWINKPNEASFLITSNIQFEREIAIWSGIKSN